MEAKGASAAVAAAVAATARGIHIAATSDATVAPTGLAPCGRLAGLRSENGQAEAEAAARTAPASPEPCAAAECSGLYAAFRSLISFEGVALPAQSRHLEDMGNGARLSHEDSECKNTDVGLLPAQSCRPLGSPLHFTIQRVGASAHAMQPRPAPLMSAAWSTMAMSTQATPAPVPKRVTPRVPAAASALVAASAAASEIRGTAAARSLTPVIQESEVAVPPAAARECVSPRAGPAATAEAVNAVTRDRQTHCAGNPLCKKCLCHSHKTECCSTSTSPANHDRDGWLQLTSSNTFLSKSTSIVNNGEAPTHVHCCGKAEHTAVAAGVAASSASSSSATRRRLLSADIVASSAASPAAGSACLSLSPFATACTPAISGLFTATHTAGIIACPSTGEIADRSTTATLLATSVQLQQSHQRHKHQLPQRAGHWQLNQQIRQYVHHHFRQSQPTGQLREQLQCQPLRQQHQQLQEQQQKSQQEQRIQEQRQQRQTHHQQPGHYQEIVQQQRLHVPQEQQLPHQRGHHRRPPHKSIRLFLLEDYEGPELPPSHPLVSLCFGTSSEEEEEDQQKQHGANNTATLLAPVAASAGGTSLATTSNAVGCAVLKKKKKRERKVSIGATDALWQPHFHPHNQEFRVRYRYKGSMRLKTLSCARFGREGARRLTAAFVQRWQKSGRRIAAKTHRSKLALSDLPPDLHLLPVYDKKRPTAPAVNASDTSSNSSSYCLSSCSTTSATNYSCNTSRSTSISTPQSSCSRSGSKVSNPGDTVVQCQNAGIPAPHVLGSPSAAQPPSLWGLNKSLPLCAISPPSSLLEVLPSAAPGIGATCASSVASASAASALAPLAAVSYVPTAEPPVRDICAPFSSVDAAAGAAPAATVHRREGTGMMLPQKKNLPDSRPCAGSNATLSWKASHTVSSQAHNTCETDSFVDPSAASSSDSSRSSPAAMSLNGTTSSCSVYSTASQLTRCSNSHHLLRICYRSSECCSANMGPLSSCCHALKEYSSAGISKFTAMKRIIDSAASSTSAAAGTDTAEATSTSEGASVATEITVRTFEGPTGASLDAATCPLPLRVFGSSADSLDMPSPVASFETSAATPEGLVTELVPPAHVQPSVAAEAFLGAPASAPPMAPTAAVSASSDAAGSTAGATSAASPAVCHSDPAAVLACIGEPDAGCAAPSTSETFVPATVAAIPAAASGAATSVVPVVLRPAAAASYLSAATLAYAPAATARTALSHSTAGTYAALPGPAAPQENPSRAEGTPGTSSFPVAAACATPASAAATASPPIVDSSTAVPAVSVSALATGTLTL